MRYFLAIRISQTSEKRNVQLSVLRSLLQQSYEWRVITQRMVDISELAWKCTAKGKMKQKKNYVLLIMETLDSWVIRYSGRVVNMGFFFEGE